MTSRNDWTLITVTYNNSTELHRWWSSRRHVAHRWIVVDNASNDDSVEVAKSLGAEVIRLDRNVGFAAANNAGLARVKSEWVAFVNPDVAVDPETFPRIAAVCTRFGSICAPQLVNPDGSVQANGRGLPFLADKLAHRGVVLPGSGLQQYLPPVEGNVIYVAWVMGAAVCGRRETFEGLGGWDERYFLYYEDHELGLQAWAHGIPVILDGTITWRHEWKRATKAIAWSPWRRELSSALTFFSHHPRLLWSRRAARGLYSDISERSGQSVEW